MHSSTGSQLPTAEAIFDSRPLLAPPIFVVAPIERTSDAEPTKSGSRPIGLRRRGQKACFIIVDKS